MVRFMVLLSICLWVCAGVWLAEAQDNGERGLKLIRVKNEQGQTQEVALYDKSYALVIGVSEYTGGWPKLPGVKKDVGAVKEALEKHGFVVELVRDADKIRIDKAMSGFLRKYGLQRENRLLFYFAGHGYTLKDSEGVEMGYIVPADAPLPKDLGGFLEKAVDMQQIDGYAKKIQAKHALFLFDSCFSGSLFEIVRAVPEDISVKTAKPVRQFITSGSAEEQVPDRSIFREQLVSGLEGEADADKDGYITGTELGAYLQKTVVNYSHKMQNPQYGKIRHRSLDKGDFVFQVAKVPVPPDKKPGRPGESDFSLAELEKRAKELEESKAAWNTWQGKMQKGYEDTRQYEQRDVPGEWKIQAWKDFAKSFAQDNPYSIEDDTMRQTAQANIARLEKTAREDQQAKERAERLAEALRRQQEDTARRCQVSGCGNYKASGSSYCSEHKCQKCNSRAVENGLCSQHQPPKPSVPQGFTYLREKTYTCGGKSYTVKEYRHNHTGMEFVLIPGGTFEMGSNDGEGDERPVHTVTIKSFLMSKYETTQAVWQKIMGNNPSNFKGDNRPVEQVSWNDCQSFCQKTGLQLATEAQWEYACRAGTQTKYYWGSGMDNDYAWYDGNSGSQTHDVGGKQPNAFGLYDMSGNVWEWCQDWYHDSYNNAPRDGSAWESPTGSYRVNRGGSWYNYSTRLRSALRGWYVPGNRLLNLGVRFVCSVHF